MLPLEALIEEARKEARKDMGICNACRYCEGYCAVFPAMERRLSFSAADLNYLANLCHNCGECFHACQYAPPHAFAVNVPQSLAKVRAASYRQHAWPGPLARLFDRNGLFAALALAIGLSLMLALALALNGHASALFEPVPGGNFYRFMPHGVMAGAFGAVGGFVLLALLIGGLRFWKDSGESLASLTQPFALREALRDVLTLKYLHGGGTGCASPGEPGSSARRLFHHFTMYGFLLCFAATSVATVYHYAFGWPAPYGYLSLPVLLGTVGGVGLLIGPAGLWWVKRQREPATADAQQNGMDVAFIALLGLTSASGLALLALRETAALGSLLVVHLGIVLALFITLPYGKFVHGLYRGAALLKYALERRRPHHGVGGE